MNSEEEVSLELARLNGRLTREVRDLRGRNAELLSILRVAVESTEADCQMNGTPPFPWFHQARAALTKPRT